MSATKFWPINGTGSYSPESNTQILIQGVVGTTGIDSVSATAVTAINALGATNVKIKDLDVFVASATGTSIVFASTYTGATGNRQVNYYNGKRPSFGLDGPITAILPVASSPAALTIIDNAGNTGTFAAGSLKQGTVYNFSINTVTAITSGNFIGLSEF